MVTAIVGPARFGADRTADDLGERRGPPLGCGAGRAARGALGSPEPFVFGVDRGFHDVAVFAGVHAIQDGRAIECR